MGSRTDYLYNVEMKDIIRNFNNKILSDFTLAELEKYTDYFNKSVILVILKNNPTSEDAISCVIAYLNEHFNNDQSFLLKFQKLYSMRMSLHHNYLGRKMQFTVKFTFDNCEPMSRITQDTVNCSVIRMMRDSLNKSTLVYNRREIGAVTGPLKPFITDAVFVNRLIGSALLVQQKLDTTAQLNGKQMNIMPKNKVSNKRKIAETL